MNNAGSEVRRLRRDLRVLEREIELSLASQTVCCGVTVAQCHLLLEVEERGETSVTALAAALELDKSTLSRNVDGLCRAGYLRRETDPRSRRQQVICLTAEGQSKVGAINEVCDRYYARLIGSLSPARRNALLEGAADLGTAMKRARLEGRNPCSQ